MIAARIIEMIAPSHCLGCGAEGRLVCESCRVGLETPRAASCYACNRLSPAGRTCATCRPASQLAGVVVARRYEGLTEELIRQLKYHGQQQSARLCGELLAGLLCRADYDLVTFVPAAHRRELRRGYNQAELIAREVARLLALPCTSLLYRVSETQQVGHSRAERLQQATGAYQAKLSRLVIGARILVVDDVATTGATLAACAAALRATGAKSVWGAVVAKH